MGRHSNVVMTKDEYLDHIKNNTPDNHVFIISNILKEISSSKKQKQINLKFVIAHEVFDAPDDVRNVVNGNVVTTTITASRETISKEYSDGIDNGSGVFGFSID